MLDSPDTPHARQPEFSGIPTDDPQAALEFCRSLVRFMHASAGSTDRTDNAIPKISIVIPVYNEQDNVQVLYDRLTVTLQPVEPNYEIILVDDGSRDRSLELMQMLADHDRRVMVIELARNFGHQIAISAGLDYARGDGVIVMDADLQDPPEVLPQFIAKWREGHDVVYAIRERRKESWPKRAGYKIFYRLLQRIANISIPLDSGDFCIMDRRVVEVLTGMPERNRFVRGLRSWIGLDQIGLAYERANRYAGQTKYTYSRLIYLALDGLVSFSFVPLRAITLLGFTVSVISVLLALIYFVERITIGLYPQGFATTIVAILFLAGMQLMTLGVIGEYIGRIFEEVKRRPLYVVRRVAGTRS